MHIVRIIGGYTLRCIYFYAADIKITHTHCVFQFETNVEKHSSRIYDI